MLRIGCPCVLPLLLSVCAAADLPVLHPAPANMLPSPLYQVEVDGRPLFVYPCTVGGTVKDASGAIDPDPPETTTPRPAAFCYFDSAAPCESPSGCPKLHPTGNSPPSWCGRCGIGSRPTSKAE